MKAIRIALIAMGLVVAGLDAGLAAERPPQVAPPSAAQSFDELDFRSPGSRSRAVYEGPLEPGATQSYLLVGRVSWLKILLPGRPSIFGNVLFTDDPKFNAEISFERDMGRPFFEIDLNRNALGSVSLVGLRMREELSDAGQILIGTDEVIGINAYRFWLWPSAAESNRKLITANLLDILIRFDDGQYATFTVELDDEARELMQFVLEEEAVRLLQ